MFQLPPVTFGCSHEHATYPGTISISATTLAAIVADIIESLARQNVAGLIVVNGHGGNAVLTNVVQQANHPKNPVKVGLYPSREDWAEARTAAGIHSSNHDDMHAGELETSILLATHLPARRLADQRPHRQRPPLPHQPRHPRLHTHRRYRLPITGHRRQRQQ